MDIRYGTKYLPMPNQSDAGIGFCFSTFNARDHPIDLYIYGKWMMIFYFGKYFITVNQRTKKIEWGDYFATGCGG